MTLFNKFFFSIYNYHKTSFKKKANKIAVFYVSALQISLVLLFGSFFAAFFKQMKQETITSENGWMLFIIISIGIYFKNWMTYNGRNRMIINAKTSNNKKLQYNIVLLWLLPVANITLAIILLGSFL
jgi:hypothetical protein